MLRRLFIISLASALLGCGFHLKGDAVLSSQLKQLTLSESSDKAFNKELKRQLKKAGAMLVNDDEESAFLSVRFNVLPEIKLAASSETGLLISQLNISVVYSLKTAAGKWLVQQKELTQSAEFESDSNQLLAKNNEKRQRYQKMKQNLVSLLMYQLQLVN